MRNFLGLLLVLCGFFRLAPAEATVRIDIDLTTQTMHVASSTGSYSSWAVSTARAGYVTPRGTYHPQSLQLMHYSKKYYNSPMPHSIFFYGQYAIHGTTAVGDLGRPASHGCIRLAPANAATLYGLVNREGAAIQISGQIAGSAATGARRRVSSVLAYASHRPARTLKQWAADPLNNR